MNDWNNPKGFPSVVKGDEETSGFIVVLHTAPLNVIVEPPLTSIESVLLTDESVMSDNTDPLKMANPCAT